MAREPRILIAGGSGVFGRLLAQELLRTTAVQLVIAGRKVRRAADACRSLSAASGRVEPRMLDLWQPGALTRAANDCFAVACTAGPFQDLRHDLPREAVSAGAHWLDIADAPGWVLPTLADGGLGATAAAAGLAVMPGLSTTPALTGVLARLSLERVPETRRARFTLFIGNRNSKGAAAIASALGAHLSDPRPVTLPIGRRLAYCLPTADASLLHEELGLTAEFRVAFEFGATGRLAGLLAPLARRLSSDARARVTSVISAFVGPLASFGSDAGILQAETRPTNGPWVRWSLAGSGQRLAILPCAFALQSLLSGALTQRGTVHPAGWTSTAEWLRRLQECGVRCSWDA